MMLTKFFFINIFIIMGIMNQKDVRNNVHRSGFDLSRRVCFTAKVGELLPINWLPVLPGDKFDIDLNSFGRTAPLQTATFGRIREYYDVFFVPYRLLWKDFPQWIIQTKQPVTSKDLSSAIQLADNSPYFTNSSVVTYFDRLDKLSGSNVLDDGAQNRYFTSLKLLSYLRYNPNFFRTGGPQLRLNPFPLAAYQKIYQDYFRFSQWETSSPWTFNFDFTSVVTDGYVNPYALEVGSLIPATVPSGFVLGKNLLSMQYCNYDRDMLNGVLPNPQFGDTSFVDVVSQNAGQLTGNLSFIASQASGGTSLNRSSNGQVVSSTGGNVYISSAVYSASGFANLQQQFSILSLRKQEAFQKWREITQSGDLDYQSQISKHWNESVPDALSGKCQYIGGTARNIDVSEVINNNLADTGSDANIAGKGILSNNGHVRFDNKGNDYGILMVMYHAKPIVEWQSNDVIDKEILKTTLDQYAIPEFDNLGNEKVMMYEMAAGDAFTASRLGDVAGYAPRYYEYKTSYDLVLGEFQNTLKPWVIPFSRYLDGRIYSSNLSYLDFKVSPSVVDDLFGVVSNGDTATDHFYNTCYMDIKAVRNLSRDGLPY